MGTKRCQPARAIEVTERPQPHVEIRTRRDFFLTGMLAHKPPTQSPLTFDAFRLTADDRDRLDAVLAGESGVEHARLRTEGFGFGLKSALGIADTMAAGEGAAQRIQLRRSCEDTVLGQWMPRAYAEELHAQIADEERGRLRQL
jgi:hypothetical protein